MDEYIKKEDALKALESQGVTKNMRAHRAVQAIPGTAAEPVIFAEWLPSSGAWKECSHCHEEEFLPYLNNKKRCPNCGARMIEKGGADNEET